MRGREDPVAVDDEVDRLIAADGADQRRILREGGPRWELARELVRSGRVEPSMSVKRKASIPVVSLGRVVVRLGIGSTA